MGIFFDKFKRGLTKSEQLARKNYLNVKSRIERERDPFKKQNKFKNPNIHKDKALYDPNFDDFKEDYLEDDFKDNYYRDDFFEDSRIQPSQKPESFHHFILENQYKDLEKSIRGVKDVWDKNKEKWVTIRKELHCFTNEEAEEILRTAQSHLSTDIKLGYINSDSFGEYMDALYEELEHLFRSIAEYRYGRYGDYETQYKMKLQNKKIFLELWTRIQANYSRSIKGTENRYTHDSVKGQESLQQADRDYSFSKGYM